MCLPYFDPQVGSLSSQGEELTWLQLSHKQLNDLSSLWGFLTYNETAMKDLNYMTLQKYELHSPSDGMVEVRQVQELCGPEGCSIVFLAHAVCSTCCFKFPLPT